MHELAELVGDLPEGRVLKTGERLKRLREELEKGIVDTPANRVKLAARIEEMSLLGSTINRTRRRDVAEFKVERRPQTVKRSEEHTSELQSLMRISYAVFCLKKKTKQ